MIEDFKCKDTEKLWETGRSKRFSNIKRSALNKLMMLEAAVELLDLASPPGNHLESLSGDRNGQHSIRINKQWRICFVWNSGAHDVEIVDYH